MTLLCIEYDRTSPSFFLLNLIARFSGIDPSFTHSPPDLIVYSMHSAHPTKLSVKTLHLHAHTQNTGIFIASSSAAAAAVSS